MFRLALIKLSKPADKLANELYSTAEPPDFLKIHQRLYYLQLDEISVKI
jgi:hypothetical protein